jgi:hypothetical protein
MGSFAMRASHDPYQRRPARVAAPSYAPPPQAGPKYVGSMPPGGGVAPSVGGGGGTGTFTAQTSPALDALQGRYDKYLSGLESNTGRIMDIAGSKLRDIREGGRTSLQASEALRGIGSSNRVANYDAATARSQQGAIADITTQREGTLGAALQGGLGIAKAPADLALSEKGLQLSAAAQQQQAANSSLQAYLSLLQANRSSPIYSGFSPSYS